MRLKILITASSCIAFAFVPVSVANVLNLNEEEVRFKGSVVPPKTSIRYRIQVTKAGCFNFENTSAKTSIFANLSHRDGGQVANILGYAQDHGRKLTKFALNAGTYFLDVRHMSPHKGGVFEINIWRTAC